MRSRVITKQRVVKFCEGCAYILGQLFVTALGLLVMGALGFAIYQAIKSFF
jgi:preprotein translocase subunit Sss1